MDEDVKFFVSQAAKKAGFSVWYAVFSSSFAAASAAFAAIFPARASNSPSDLYKKH
ncbi:MAG TPA: hypothetical protein PKI76_03055 [Oscillospiraceae bacterium]|nr:hypothetical protein [Oscillospiraceae bacterium]HNW04346.1 hypothetical protein [Oscillospiraceae bacterium]